jgi:phosphoglycolate phosphatase
VKRGVIFDLDGTLVDTPRAIVETIDGVLRSRGFEGVAPEDIRATVGMPLEAAFGDLMGAQSSSGVVVEAISAYRQTFAEVVLPKAPELLFDGVAEGLAALEEGGATLAIATSKIVATAEALLEAAGIRGRFGVVVGADQVSRPKPDPETALLALEGLGMSAEDCVVVGDTTHDLLMAKGARIASIGVTYGVHDAKALREVDPTHLAGSFWEVVECCLQQEERMTRVR